MAGPIKFQIDDLVIDATPEVDFDADVETTDHPIEEGSDSTDHARSSGSTGTFETMQVAVMTCGLEREVRDATNSDWEKAGATDGTAQQVYEKLVKMKDAHELHTLTTVRGLYENMMITKLSSPTRANLGDGLMFKIAFKSIRIVTSGTAQLVAREAPKTRKPTKKADQAKKQGEQQTAEQRRSTALKIGQFFTDGL